MPKTNDRALDTFITATKEIDAMLKRPAAIRADHLGYSPEDVHWGHVGTLDHYLAHHREITETAF